MKAFPIKSLLLFLFLALIPILAKAQNPDSLWVMQQYTKTEVNIPMRDGVKLYTAIYTPTDKSEKHPILICRTPYSCSPYGQAFRPMWYSHWMNYLREHYIIVVQDVRGRFMSEGKFVDVRPFIEHKRNKTDIDEASDAYDTIDWLIKNTTNNNGKVGAFGISYPGFYATMCALSGHPALKAVSPQAPVTDWFSGDDFHHNGAFMLMDAFGFYSGFGKPRPALTTKFASGYNLHTQDAYNKYLNINTIDSLSKLMGDSVEFWKELCNHPNYDSFWQARNPRNFVHLIPKSCATLVVGGFFDAEDCYGAINLYKAIEAHAHNDNRLVLGPWAHGYWARDSGLHLGNVWFGTATSLYYQTHFELPFFNYHLKAKGEIGDIKECNTFSSGDNNWKSFNRWADTSTATLQHITYTNMYFDVHNSLSLQQPQIYGAYDYYLSDPAKPVPYIAEISASRGNNYMTDDQRFASKRPDVLCYESPVLEKDMALAGPLMANLFVNISTTDADFVVKLIDVFPDDFEYTDSSYAARTKKYPMGGYQMLVRGEVMRGRYRRSLTQTIPFVPDEISEVSYSLPDVCHTFKKGHRIMVQIQSSWFPLVDRNPQNFVDIYHAKPEDFKKTTIAIIHDRDHPSKIVLPIIQ